MYGDFMANNRYKELINENNERVSYLGDSYKRVADIYVKKARGYGIKSIDTEVRISEVLEELEGYNNKGIDVNIAIPSLTTYVEENVQKLSKAPSFVPKLKEIIAVSIFLLCLIGYFVISGIFNKKAELAAPTNISVVLEADKSFYITWIHNELATEGYYLEVYDGDNNLLKEVDVPMRVQEGRQYVALKDLIYQEGTVYTFKIICEETDNYAESEEAIYVYPKSK